MGISKKLKNSSIGFDLGIVGCSAFREMALAKLVDARFHPV